MKCPSCQVENAEGMKFCVECGAKLEIICPQCSFSNSPSHKFCGECGNDLSAFTEPSPPAPKEPAPDKVVPSYKPIESERKHVTALFSDISGYTAMTEKLDPEEVKEITSNIFDEISKIISKYEGFIEKFAGDAVMALFGAEKAHEDDPVRAIRAAKEIHSLVKALSPKYEKKIEQPLSMHTGINTGLVVTGEIHLEKGTHGVTGETINIAARLSDLGRADDILVGSDTFIQAEGYFDFEELKPVQIKGKSEPLRLYKVLALKEQPIKIHRLHGLRSDLIGRKAEMNLLVDAVQELEKGNGAVFSIYGTAGTGKSRLVKEFKESLNLSEIQWLEGHAYPYTQNIPYYPLFNLLSRALQIEEGDPPEKIKEKIESGIAGLTGEHAEYVPYIGSLFSQSYSEIEDVSPEYWQDQLQKAIQTILSELAHQGPTIIRLEDLHWADPSFLELIRLLLTEFREPVLFLCIYRPVISLLSSHQISSMANPYQEIRLQDLSPSESQGMVESLLKTETIPSDLQRFVQDKIEGNPFYIEEVINSLIESETLIRDNGGWRITKAIDESDISSAIHGVIAGRLDRLEKETKRILQEASVIGRAFLYDILKRITELKDRVDQSLQGLERLDLIRTRSLQPDLEYIFKHTLTQEVVYNGLLKKERKAIHERIGTVMEQLFHNKLPEFYENLAFHFRRGESLNKAIDYLIKSGEKSLGRYALEESHEYFKEAFNILADKADRSNEEEELIIDILIKWGYVYYYRGRFAELIDLLSKYESMAESLNNQKAKGMYFAWLGFAFWMKGETHVSLNYLHKALKIGEEIKDKQVIAYACTWLTWCSWDLGPLEDAVRFGERAHEISGSISSDQYIYFKPLAGMAVACFYSGDWKNAIKFGKDILKYGQKHSNIRSITLGHISIGAGHIAAGDLASSVECSKKAIQIARDPSYFHYANMALGSTQTFMGNFEEAKEPLSKVVTFDQKYGYGATGLYSYAFLGVVSVARGQMSRGVKMLEEAIRISSAKRRKTFHAVFELALGRIYLQIILGEEAISLSVLAKNIGFLIKNVPFASKKAQAHLTKAIEISKEIGAKWIVGQAYLHLGILHKAKKRTKQAKECILEAIKVFEACETEFYLKQANEIISTLDNK
jgi:class 3 adenylate cyclase/tetratricopeptide (TPR) repeat protein